jgi:hypothetical protein
MIFILAISAYVVYSLIAVIDFKLYFNPELEKIDLESDLDNNVTWH